MVIVCVPVGAPETVIVRTDDAVPPAGGSTGLVPKARLIPLGAPECARSTAEENIPTDCTSILEVAEPPGGSDKDDGDDEIVKSAIPAVIWTATST